MQKVGAVNQKKESWETGLVVEVFGSQGQKANVKINLLSQYLFLEAC